MYLKTMDGEKITTGAIVAIIRCEVTHFGDNNRLEVGSEMALNGGRKSSMDRYKIHYILHDISRCKSIEVLVLFNSNI